MEKILIVDDSAVQAAQLKSILADEYDVTIAHRAEDGLRRASSEIYSLILLDVVMPGMDGFTLLKKLQEEIITQSIPVILITSLSDVENEQRGLVLGAVDYITKPFHSPVVKARVNTHIKLYNFRQRVEQQSMTDQLTGIANRRRYDLYSRVKWGEAVRLQVPFSICMFDIDHFKAYNDTFGHPAGDKAIAAVAKTIAAHLHRSTDFFARYGGEEFVALFSGDPGEKIFTYLKKVRQAVEDLHIPHVPSVAEWVTVSIGGVTVIPPAEGSYALYLKIADTMLYDAKKHGRNRVVWADEQMKQLKEKAASPDIGKQINHSEQEVEHEMKLFGLFGKRAKEQPSPKPERAESLDDLDIYSGMRVEVTTFEGQLLFVAKLLGLRGQKAELHQYSETTLSKDSEPLPVRIRGYSDRERKAVYMEGVITPAPQNIWQVEELTVCRIGNDRAFFRLTTNIDATATMFSGLEMGEKPCKLLNISVGGASISSERRYQQDDKFLLKVKLLEDRPTSAIFSQVVRVIEKDDGKFEYGCQFLELTEEDQDKITRNIFDVQRQKRARS